MGDGLCNPNVFYGESWISLQGLSSASNKIACLMPTHTHIRKPGSCLWSLPSYPVDQNMLEEWSLQ